MKKFISGLAELGTGAKVALAAGLAAALILGIAVGGAIQSGRASAALAQMGKAEAQFNLNISKKTDDIRRLEDTLAETQAELDELSGMKLTMDSPDVPAPTTDSTPAPESGVQDRTPSTAASIRSGGWVKIFVLLFIVVVIIATLIYITAAILSGRGKDDDYEEDDDGEEDPEDDE